MHTGDLATMDEEGYLNIVGRIKDMIIRGGENVYPREIEEFLYSHPKVQDVQVIGVPDEKYGEEIMAWVKLREGQAATVEEIRDYCRGKIAHYKIPRYVQLRRRLSHDGHRQGPEVPDARRERDGAGSGEGRRHQDGVDGSSFPQPERAHQRQRVRGAHHAHWASQRSRMRRALLEGLKAQTFAGLACAWPIADSTLPFRSGSPTRHGSATTP